MIHRHPKLDERGNKTTETRFVRQNFVLSSFLSSESFHDPSDKTDDPSEGHDPQVGSHFTGTIIL